MRFTPAAIALATVLAISSSIGIGQKPQPIDPRAQSWVQRGTAAFAVKDYAAATDAFETALVLDPRSRAAFSGLAQVARAQSLPGKAIHYYEIALKLDPSDVSALQGQGLAMLAKGAVASARANLARIKTACKGKCEAADQLAGAIAHAVPPPRIVSTNDAKPPVPGATLLKE